LAESYLNNPATLPLPNSLNLHQFLQTVFVGVSGLDGTLVRPAWQANPPKSPDTSIDWMALAIHQGMADANAYLGVGSDGISANLQRNEELQVDLSFYGPNAYSLAGIVRDGFEIPQNLDALTFAKMGFISATLAMHAPDLINEEWRDKWIMTVGFRRQLLRTYPVSTFVSVNGTITTVVGTETYLRAFQSTGGNT
jgi:hypothetical protein